MTPLSVFVLSYGSDRGGLSADDTTNSPKMEFECRPGAIASSLVAPLAVFVVSFGSERGSLGADAIANSNMRSSVPVQRRAPSTRHSATPLSILVMSYGDERGGLSADVITIDIKMGSMEFSAARRSLCLELPCQRLCLRP